MELDYNYQKKVLGELKEWSVTRRTKGVYEETAMALHMGSELSLEESRTIVDMFPIYRKRFYIISPRDTGKYEIACKFMKDMDGVDFENLDVDNNVSSSTSRVQINVNNNQTYCHITTDRSEYNFETIRRREMQRRAEMNGEFCSKKVFNLILTTKDNLSKWTSAISKFGLEDSVYTIKTLENQRKFMASKVKDYEKHRTILICRPERDLKKILKSPKFLKVNVLLYRYGDTFNINFDNSFEASRFNRVITLSTRSFGMEYFSCGVSKVCYSVVSENTIELETSKSYMPLNSLVIPVSTGGYSTIDTILRSVISEETLSNVERQTIVCNILELGKVEDEVLEKARGQEKSCCVCLEEYEDLDNTFVYVACCHYICSNCFMTELGRSTRENEIIKHFTCHLCQRRIATPEMRKECNTTIDRDNIREEIREKYTNHEKYPSLNDILRGYLEVYEPTIMLTSSRFYARSFEHDYFDTFAGLSHKMVSSSCRTQVKSLIQKVIAKKSKMVLVVTPETLPSDMDLEGI